MISDYTMQTWKKNIMTIANESGVDVRLSRLFCATLDFLYHTNLSGACHGVSAMLYVAYSELGFEPKLCTGIFGKDNWESGHSWIELGGKVFDASCCFSSPNTPKPPPVFCGRTVDTMKATEMVYGISSNHVAEDVQAVLDTTLPRVMNGKYERLRGASLWQALDNVCMLAKVEIFKITDDWLDVRGLEKKYEGTRWVLCKDW